MGRSVHHIPGRIRFKIPDLHRDNTLARALSNGLAAREGVERVDVRLVSRSMIVHYDPRRANVDDLVSFMEGASGKSLEHSDLRLFSTINQDGMLAKSARHLGVVFGKTAFKVALEQVVRGGINSAYRTALARS